jgi:GTP-binding protein HflX
VDAAPSPVVQRLLALHPGSVAISAATGEGIERLIEVLDERLAPVMVDLELLIPHDRGDLLASLYRFGDVLAEAHEQDGVRLEARLPAAEASTFLPYLL